MLATSAVGAGSPAQRKLQESMDALRAEAPDAALRGAGAWLESVLANTSLASAERMRMVFAVDEAVQAHARAICEHFLRQHGHEGAVRRRLWNIGRTHWQLLSEGYRECLLAMREQGSAEPAEIASLTARAIRACGALAKWDGFRHGPLDTQCWARINQAYRLAVNSKAAELSVRLRRDRHTETTAEREFLRVVALNACGPDQLDAPSLELAARLVFYVLPRLQLTPAPIQGTLTWLDTAQPLPPARYVRAPESATLPRFFAGSDAVPSLQHLFGLIDSGEMPPALGAEDEASRRRVLSVLAHLVRTWAGEAPVRRHRRHALPGKLRVVNGLDGLMERLGGASAGQAAVWDMVDASLAGLGALAPLAEDQELRVGMLIGVHTEDGDRWRAAAVRRLWRTSDEHGRVGIELLGGHPLMVSADDGANPTRVVALDLLRRGAPVRIAVSLPGPREGTPLYLLGEGRAVKLEPISVLEHGADYQIRSYLYAP